MRLRCYLNAIERSVQRHGGGLPGLWSVIRRALKIARAMGIGGLLRRVRTSSATKHASTPPLCDKPLPAPVPLELISLKVGVMAHIFYPDLIEELASSLEQMPVPYRLMVSVVDDVAAEQVRARLAQLPKLIDLQVAKVANRGRDIAPLMLAFESSIQELDVVGHIHTKKSLYTGGVQEQWRRYLLSSLFGDRDRLAWLLGVLQAAPDLGLVYPETHASLPPWAHTWLSNASIGRALSARLGLGWDGTGYFDYPAGSMFWARVDALRPLFELGLSLEEFPAEEGQIDGTLQHAIERLFALIARDRGYRIGVLPADGSRHMATEGERNAGAAFRYPLAEQLRMAAIEARVVTLDVFDTMVLRPFTTPNGARQLLALRAERISGLIAFAEIRDDAEVAERQRLGRDPELAEIYQQLGRIGHLDGAMVQRLLELEVQTERALLRPRQGLLEALPVLAGKRLIALSDMYLPATVLRSVLPPAVEAVTDTWWISCETGRRKDADDSWARWAEQLATPRNHWLHVGDNEHSDIQLPQRAGLINPVHVLRPVALFDMVPALRTLRHRSAAQAPWPEQLWRGLLANRLTYLADTAPYRVYPTPQLAAEDAGYCVLGPILLDFLLTTAATARRRDVGSILLLAREGHLLQQAWTLLAKVHPGMQALRTEYFLASRRSTALPALAADADLSAVLAGSFNGSMRQLLVARLGTQATEVIARVDPTLLERDVFLPEMADTVSLWLQPALPSLLELAGQSRQIWLEHLSEATGGQQAMVVDLGYAGTIQRNLIRLSGEPIGGQYFALRETAKQLNGLGWAEARYFDGRNDPSGSSLILEHDLLLEALLSAPHGQFNGYFRDKSGMVHGEFGEQTLGGRGLDALTAVQNGALAFISDVCSAVNTDIASVTLDQGGVLEPLRLLAEGTWQAGAWLQDLATEDDFSGRGNVAVGRSY